MGERDIVIDAEILNGNPHLEGTRYSVFHIVSDCSHYGLTELLRN